MKTKLFESIVLMLIIGKVLSEECLTENRFQNGYNISCENFWKNIHDDLFAIEFKEQFANFVEDYVTFYKYRKLIIFVDQRQGKF